MLVAYLAWHAYHSVLMSMNDSDCPRSSIWAGIRFAWRLSGVLSNTLLSQQREVRQNWELLSRHSFLVWRLATGGNRHLCALTSLKSKLFAISLSHRLAVQFIANTVSNWCKIQILSGTLHLFTEAKEFTQIIFVRDVHYWYKRKSYQ